MTERLRHEIAGGLYVRERPGWPGGETLLFLHGLGESGLCFEGWLASEPLPGCRLLVPDLPGYGRSPRRETPLDLADQAALLADWLRARETGPVVLVGHSMGGVVAQLLAEQHPALVRALVDVDGNITVGDCGYSGGVAAQSLAAFLDDGYEALLAQVWAEGAESPASRGYYASIRLADPRLYHANSADLVARSRRGDLARRLAALAVPVLYVAGVPGGVCAETHAQLRQAGVSKVDIAPSGHWPFLDQPGQFTAALATFLERLT